MSSDSDDHADDLWFEINCLERFPALNVEPGHSSSLLLSHVRLLELLFSTPCFTSATKPAQSRIYDDLLYAIQHASSLTMARSRLDKLMALLGRSRHLPQRKRQAVQSAWRERQVQLARQRSKSMDDFASASSSSSDDACSSSSPSSSITPPFSTTSLLDLPPELVHRIASNLDPWSLVQLGSISRFFSALLLDRPHPTSRIERYYAAALWRAQTLHALALPSLPFAYDAQVLHALYRTDGLHVDASQQCWRGAFASLMAQNALLKEALTEACGCWMADDPLHATLVRITTASQMHHASLLPLLHPPFVAAFRRNLSLRRSKPSLSSCIDGEMDSGSASTSPSLSTPSTSPPLVPTPFLLATCAPPEPRPVRFKVLTHRQALQRIVPAKRSGMIGGGVVRSWGGGGMPQVAHHDSSEEEEGGVHVASARPPANTSPLSSLMRFWRL